MEPLKKQVLLQKNKQISQPQTKPSFPIPEESIFSPSFEEVIQEFNQLEEQFKNNMTIMQNEKQKEEVKNIEIVNKDASIDKKNSFAEWRNLPISSKIESDSPLSISLISLPLQSRSKFSKKDIDGMEVPQLGSSNIDGQQLQVESNVNSNQLPLTSIRRYKNAIPYVEPSQDSDDDAIEKDEKNMFLKSRVYDQRKSSEQLQECQDLNISCEHCSSLHDKNKVLEVQNNDLIQQICLLKQQMFKLQEKSKSQSHSDTKSNEDGSSQNISLDNNDIIHITQILLHQVCQSGKTIDKILKFEHKNQIQFTLQQRRMLETFSLQFRQLEKAFYFDQHQHMKVNCSQIHQKYKKLIEKINRQHNQRENKMQEDFRNFFKSFIYKNTEQKIMSSTQIIDAKQQLIRNRNKKIKTCINQKEEALQNDQIIHLRQRIDLLSINYEKQKDKVKFLQKYQKQILQKYMHENTELTKERNAYRAAANRSIKQFQQFMKLSVHLGTSVNKQKQFFHTVCQRIYQISNCIPFEDNDEQNLFLPETQDEVFDMIERIRRFYIKIDQFSVRKDHQYQSLKKHFIIFLKELIQTDNVSTAFILELINSNKELGLDYIKQFINSLKDKKSRHQSGKKIRAQDKLNLVRLDTTSVQNFALQSPAKSEDQP